jgi:hypothetical protein
MDTYSDLEVQQILQKALSRRAGEKLTRDQVAEIAKELGVSAEDFALAEAEWRAEVLKDQDRVEFIHLIRRRFRDNVVTYVLVNGGLIWLNLVIAKGVTWSVYPLIAWGILLLLEGWSVVATDGHNFERRFQAWHNQRQQERLGQQFKQKLANAASEVTDKVARTAITFTDRLSKKMEKWLDDN